MNKKKIKTSEQRHSKLLRSLVCAAVGCVLFVYGLGVGHYKWPPFRLLHEAKTVAMQRHPTSSQVTEYRGEQELLKYAFTDPVNETSLYYPPINSLEGIHHANQHIFMLREGFETAYRNLNVIDAQQIVRPTNAEPVVRVRFRYQAHEYEAFAYGRLPLSCNDQGAASLIIPGSGLNQSLGIASGDPANYHHGILKALNNEGGQIYTFIKPNEDFLAWHDGKGHKLVGDFIWNWHLNRDGSYSVSYLVESLAFTKWLQGCFKETIIAGLSQGSAAGMLTALQSQPKIVIVASGLSLLSEFAEWSGHNQLIGVPGYAKLFQKNYLADSLINSPAQWFFSWGKAEIGAYKIEAEERITAKTLDHLSNVTVSIHDGGHIFPVPSIQTFLSRYRTSVDQNKIDK